MHALADSINRASIAFAKLGSALGDRTYYILERYVECWTSNRWVDVAGGPMWWLQPTLDRAQPGECFRLTPPKAVQ